MLSLSVTMDRPQQRGTGPAPYSQDYESTLMNALSYLNQSMQAPRHPGVPSQGTIDSRTLADVQRLLLGMQGQPAPLQDPYGGNLMSQFNGYSPRDSLAGALAGTGVPTGLDQRGRFGGYPYPLPPGTKEPAPRMHYDVPERTMESLVDRIIRDRDLAIDQRHQLRQRHAVVKDEGTEEAVDLLSHLHGAPPIIHGQPPVLQAGERGSDIEGDDMEGDDRKAVARRKNREAQQRFRDRRRQMQHSMEAEFYRQWDAFDEMQETNLLLLERAHSMAVNVVIAESMLLACGGDPPDIHSLLARTMSREEFDTMLQQANASRKSFKLEKHAISGIEPLKRAAVGFIERAKKLPLYPAMQDLFDTAFRLQDAESLFLYYREWQIEMKYLLQRLEKKSSPEVEAEILEKLNTMAKIWLINTRLYPENFKQVMHKYSVPDSKAGSKWVDIAHDIRAKVSDEQLEELRDFWTTYVKDVETINTTKETELIALHNIAAALEKNADPDLYCMKDMSTSHLSLGALLHDMVCTQEALWTKAVQVSGKLSHAIGPMNVCLCHVLSSPHPPNWVAIANKLVNTDQHDMT